MAQATIPYTRSLSASIGAGMGSLIGGSGKQYYILEHKAGSRFHKAGEIQEIIIDQVEIGRDPRCQVRFDETFETVSRRHAAIIKDGANWKLFPLSQSNPTLLNGQKVQKEWFLQNGDEIQCAINGPKLGFIIPTGKKATVNSIGLSRRLALFRKQALRPYKTAITALACVLILALCGGGYMIYKQGKTIASHKEIIASQGETIVSQGETIDVQANLISRNSEELDSLNARYRLSVEDNIKIVNELQYMRRRITQVQPTEETAKPPVALPSAISILHPHVYMVKLYKITQGNEVLEEVDPNKEFISCGTGFVLDDGRFVTARRLVSVNYSNYYRFDETGQLRIRQGSEEEAYWDLLLNYAFNFLHNVTLHFRATSPDGSFFEFTDNMFDSNNTHDRAYRLSHSEARENFTLPAGISVMVGATGVYDWAYCQTLAEKGLTANKELSRNLQQGAELYILGYSAGRGKGIPILSKAVCLQNGLDADGTIIVSYNNAERGDSGAPVFVLTKEGKYEVVGILSGSNDEKGRLVPISAIY